MAKNLPILAALLALLALAGPLRADWPEESAAIGARDHPKVLQRYGGALQDQALAAYVADIGASLVAVSERPGEPWRFVVLDSPEVNAFALPGGYVYVTRGLLALAQDESELAAVLAHEIIHVTAAHVEARAEAQKDALVGGALSALVTGLFGGGEDRLGNALRSGVETALGQMGSYSKAQEFAADEGGIALLRAAGYDPAAQADFLAALAAYGALKAAQQGRAYDETTAPVFADHPAPAERQARARALAETAPGGRRGQAEYLAAIDGMLYGQSHRAGIIEGRVFIHPRLGFTFEAAPGMRIENAARQINIFGPGRALLVMSGGRGAEDLGQALRAWAQQVPLRERQGRGLRHLRAVTINGLQGATATLSLRQRGRRTTLRLTVIRFQGGLIRFASTVPRGDEAAARAHWQTVESFRPLQAGDSVPAETRIIRHQTRAGETVASLAGPVSEAEFRVLNRLPPEGEPAPGQFVKLVSY